MGIQPRRAFQKFFVAFELFGSLVSLMVFTKNEKGGERGVLHLTGPTDNSGNTSALSLFNVLEVSS